MVDAPESSSAAPDANAPTSNADDVMGIIPESWLVVIESYVVNRLFVGMFLLDGFEVFVINGDTSINKV